MNICTARKSVAHRKILSGLVGLVMMAIPMSVVAGEPYNPTGDIAAYQSYPAQYGQPMLPPSQYPGPSGSYARRNQLLAQLNYAEAQYNQARQSGNRQAAKYWKKDIKHLRHELSGRGHAEGPRYGGPAYMPTQQPAYSPPMREYGPPPSPAYAQQPYPQAGYPPTGYPQAGYPQATTAPYVAPGYAAPGATGSTSGLGSLLGPLLGTGAAAPSGAPNANYPQAGYPNGAAGYQ